MATYKQLKARINTSINNRLRRKQNVSGVGPIMVLPKTENNMKRTGAHVGMSDSEWKARQMRYWK